MKPTLLTTKEAAHQLGVSAKLLEHHRAEMRGLPYIRIGGKSIRYLIDDVQLARAFGALDFAEIKRRRRAVSEIRRRKNRRARRVRGFFNL